MKHADTTPTPTSAPSTSTVADTHLSRSRFRALTERTAAGREIIPKIAAMLMLMSYGRSLPSLTHYNNSKAGARIEKTIAYLKVIVGS